MNSLCDRIKKIRELLPDKNDWESVDSDGRELIMLEKLRNDIVLNNNYEIVHIIKKSEEIVIGQPCIAQVDCLVNYNYETLIEIMDYAEKLATNWIFS